MAKDEQVEVVNEKRVTPPSTQAFHDSDKDDWRSRPPARWNTSDVAHWIRSLGPKLAMYGAVLEREDVNGDILLTLTEADLKELGVGTFRDRRTLFGHIKNLKTSTQKGEMSSKLCCDVHCGIYAHGLCIVMIDEEEPEPDVVDDVQGAVLVAVASYEGGPGGKLPFQEGDVMTVLSKLSEHWYRVRNSQGLTGLAPANYLVALNEAPALPPVVGVPTLGSTDEVLCRMIAIAPFTDESEAKLDLHPGDKVDVHVKVTPDWYDVSKEDGSRGLAPSNYLQELPPVMYRAVASFEAAESGQLSVERGDELELVSNKSKSWHIVKNTSNGKTGAVPVSFLEDFDPEAGSTLFRVISPVSGRGCLNIDRGEEVRLVQRVSADWHIVRKSSGLTGLAPANHLEEFVPEPAMYICKAAFKGAPGKLPLKLGQKMLLLKKVTADWFDVQLTDGTQGLVPSNYVEEIKPASEPLIRLTAIADFTGTGDQLSMKKGEQFALVLRSAPGWLMVRKSGSTTLGLVPANHVREEIVKMRCKLTYEKNGQDQLSCSEGDVMVLFESREDGFSLVEDENGNRGLMPSHVLEANSSAPRRGSEAPRPKKMSLVPLPHPGGLRTLPVLPSASERNRLPAECWSKIHLLSWLRDKGPPLNTLQFLFNDHDINGATLLDMSRTDVVSLGAEPDVVVILMDAVSEELVPPPARKYFCRFFA